MDLHHQVIRATFIRILLTISTNVLLHLDYIDLGFSWIENDWSWRGPLLMQPVFAVILLIGTCLLPESPRWLIKRGQNDKALNVLSIMYLSC